jgi:heme/copper-type cytochrome/quinol oxidase subunit 4
MLKLAQSAVTPVWVLLMIATAASWSLAADHRFEIHKAVTVAVLAVAFVKVALIGMYFMELRHASPWLRNIFHVWYFAVCSVVVVMYLAS